MFNRIISIIMSAFLSFFNWIGVMLGMENTYKFENVSYGTHERHTLNLYIPADKESVGLVLMIHGGAWIGGDKADYAGEVERVLGMGYAVATVNYRYISDDVDLIDVTDDIQLAVAKIKELSEKRGIEINKMVLTGISAGGHLAMLYAYSRDDVSAIKPVAVLNYCGPTDLSDDAYYFDNGLGDGEYVAQVLSWACGYKHTFATREEAKEALFNVSPLKYVDENTVPTVINHGVKDNIVPFSNAVSLRDKFDTLGVTYVFNAYPNSGHGLNEDAENTDKSYELYSEYLETYLG
ncbi:MAG: alpha/beta hydrolase [Acutalibacteraceae bacterium]|nr:alpha/beta hydrolase [Acutalibacteraceae bacterium]